MNKLFQISNILILFIAISCNGKVENITVDTPTIQCGMCQKTIEMGLKKLPGVSKSRVELDSKTTVVTYNPDQIDLLKIEKTISELGYQANKIKADGTAYESLPACCKIGGMDKK